MKEFQKGQRIKTVSGGELEVIQKLGEGGQGVVYKVNYNGKPLALKWYFGNKLNNADKFYRNIQNNIKQGTPTGAFLWPLEITEYFEGSFGYLMELRPPEYKDFSLFLLAKVHFANIEALINTALCITNGFRELHNRGYSYQDLNDGNFFVNPKTGDVLICDNDNVAPYGENLGIAGKCRYMAPEVVMGQKRPDSHTDRFSLAVVLYMLMPYLPNEEISVDCLKTNSGIIMIPRVKGATRVEAIRYNPDILATCRRFFERIPLEMPCNIQFKYLEGISMGASNTYRLLSVPT